MSAATAPKPDDAPEPAADADGWALLEGLRRRIDDQAALGRKTTAQVSQLAESIAGLVAQQRRRSLWLNVNSFVAYLMFTILCAAGCYLLYQSRARELAAARDQAVGERDAAVRRADDAGVRAAARDAADARAWEIYQLLEAGKRGDAVAKLDALRDQPLSKTERAVLAARVHDTQVMEVDAALKAAIAAFKAGRPGDVVKPLEAALAVEPAGARAATIHYYLGVAYARTDLSNAAAHLQAAIAGEVDQEDARFQLASVLDRSGAYGQARAEYDRFATAHPQSQLAVFAMRRSATLVRLPAVAPAAVPAPAAGAMSPGPGVPAAVPGAVPAPGSAVGRPIVPAPGVVPAPGSAVGRPIVPAPSVVPAPGGAVGRPIVPAPGVAPGSAAGRPAAPAPGVAPAPGSPAGRIVPAPGVAPALGNPAGRPAGGAVAPSATGTAGGPLVGPSHPVGGVGANGPRPAVGGPAPAAAPRPAPAPPAKPVSSGDEPTTAPPTEPSGQ